MEIHKRNPVGRPRSFDEDSVLHKAMDVFWQKGYEATSMTDLLAATGLHKGSLYQAFGDKHSLFVRALRTYIQELGGTMGEILRDAPSGVEGLRRAMYAHVEMGENDEFGKVGCMVLNTLAEFATNDPEVMAVLDAGYAMRMRMISEAVARAQAEGGLRTDWAPRRIANLLAAGESGILLELKGPLDRQVARSMVDDLLESLS